MAGSLQPRVKVWVSAEDVEYDDLNAEFDNLLLAAQPLLIDDYSTNASQMQVQTDPGEAGTESLATTLAAEIARLRFMIKELSGEAYWYESPPASLNDLVNALGTGLLDNRIASGRVRTDSQFPTFLVPNGAARTVKADGSPVNLIYYIDGIQYTISTDVTITGLTAAPSSNNTALINDGVALSDPAWTRHTGENGSEIPVDAMATEITALIGKFAGFKLAGAATEYFIAKVKSATALTEAKRGYFFDSTDAPVPRSAYTDNDTITLMKLTWVFARTDGSLTVTYTNPVWSDDEPTSPAQGDYWFDTSAEAWKRFDVSAFVAANATLIGVAIQDGTNTVAARSFEYFRNWENVNTIEVWPESNSQVKSRWPGAEISVWGTSHRFSHNVLTWDMTADLDSGVTEAASTYYFFYITETGDKIISNVRPHDRREDLRGYYHPSQSWRCVGWAFNDASSNLTAVESYFSRYPNDAVLPPQTASAPVELVDQVIPVDTTGGAITMHLPPAAEARGHSLTFIKTAAANLVTLDAFSTETINGTLTIVIGNLNGVIKLTSDGANWLITSRNDPVSASGAGDASSTGSGAVFNWPETFDSHGAFAAGQFTVPPGLGGRYRVHGGGTQGTVVATYNIYVDGTSALVLGSSDTDVGNFCFTGTVGATQGQTIDVRPNATVDFTANSGINVERVE